MKISYNGKEMSKNLVVQEDTRIQLTPEQRAARRDLLTKLRQVGAQAGLAQFTIAALRTNVNNEIESWKRPGGPRVPDNVKQAAEALLKRIDEAYPAWGTPPSEISTASQAGPPLVERAAPLPQRVLQLAFSIEGYAAPVTSQQSEQATILTQKVTDAAAVVRKLAQEDLPALNKLMNEANVPHIIMPMPAGPPPGGNRPPNQ